MNRYIVFTEQVQRALENREPVVALESTLFAHGLPYPENIQLYNALEEMAQSQGVVPAVVAIVHGQIQVGLDSQNIYDLCTSKKYQKASLRDLPVLLSCGLCGATTVSATMQVAAETGIRTFVTGGIGGVHSGGADTFDISVDLLALTRFPVVVICSGAKSILDLQKTRELLETLGITVLGYRSSHFPAFFVQESGLTVDYQVETVDEVMKLLAVKDEMDIPGGILLTNPIPLESQVDPELLNRSLQSLLLETEERGITGKDITPYLLGRLKEKTNGATLQANRKLIENNMQLGIQLAKSLQGY